MSVSERHRASDRTKLTSAVPQPCSVDIAILCCSETASAGPDAAAVQDKAKASSEIKCLSSVGAMWLEHLCPHAT